LKQLASPVEGISLPQGTTSCRIPAPLPTAPKRLQDTRRYVHSWFRCVGNGSLVFRKGFRFADLVDGTSQTFAVGERNSEHSPSTWLGVIAGAAHAPDRITAVATTPPNSDQGAPFNFSSYHPAGTNFLAAAGSAHLVAETKLTANPPPTQIHTTSATWVNSSWARL
jgi:hypothetical protein